MPESRSAFLARRLNHWRLGQEIGAARGPYTAERNAECDALAAEAAGVTWAPEPTADRADGAMEEREAVVRDLRAHASQASEDTASAYWAGWRAACDGMAERIEAGAHRKDTAHA